MRLDGLMAMAAAAGLHVECTCGKLPDGQGQPQAPYLPTSNFPNSSLKSGYSFKNA